MDKTKSHRSSILPHHQQLQVANGRGKEEKNAIIRNLKLVRSGLRIGCLSAV